MMAATVRVRMDSKIMIRTGSGFCGGFRLIAFVAEVTWVVFAGWTDSLSPKLRETFACWANGDVLSEETTDAAELRMGVVHLACKVA